MKMEQDERAFLRAYEWIKHSIDSGNFQEGQPLSENFVAKEVGVSRTPVREALRLLEQENYIKIIPGKGAFVSGVSLQDIKEIYDIRKLLEPFAAETAVLRVPEDDIVSMEREWSSMYKRNGDVAWDRVSEMDFLFHLMIVKHASNKRIQNIISSYHAQIRRFQMLSAKSLSNIKDTIEQHLELAASLKRRDTKKFPALILEHIIKSESYIWKEYNAERVGKI